MKIIFVQKVNLSLKVLPVFEGFIRVEVCLCTRYEARSHSQWAGSFWTPSISPWSSSE